MSGVVIGNPFGQNAAPPAPPVRNPFASPALGAPYAQQPVAVNPFAAPDPYAAAAAAMFPPAPQDPNIIDGHFTEVPASPLQGAIPQHVVLAPPMIPAAPATLVTEADYVSEYVALRNQKSEISERHTEELAPIKDRLTEIERIMLDRLNSNGVESVRTTQGTAFKKLTSRFSIDDGETFMQWVQANDQLDMLSRAVKPDAIKEYLERTGTLPPGVKVFSEWGVQFRKA